MFSDALLFETGASLVAVFDRCSSLLSAFVTAGDAGGGLCEESTGERSRFAGARGSAWGSTWVGPGSEGGHGVAGAG